ncbi:MAG: glycosyltransferase [Eubacterium sp.]|nr:glycosyltransferase [Eubacterium sp.]
MKVLIVNPILYTSETHEVKKVNSIKDTMIYDLCLAFVQKGIDVTLVGASDFKPIEDEDYPFEIKWLDAKFKKILFPNVIPYCPDIKRLVKKNSYDFIISSEVFSLNSLMLARRCSDRLIVWHELAKHNNILKRIPSKLWYSVVARHFFNNTIVVARSREAKDFISHYCKNVSDTIVDHGVNLDKFTPETNKDNCFSVCSQLIERKQIDKIIKAFDVYIKKYDSSSHLIIMGDGDEKENLMSLTAKLGIAGNVNFTGKVSHEVLIKKLQKSRAMLVYTKKDNNMVSIVESIAVGTPVITTSVPYNASYIKANSLGIVNDNWNEDDLYEIAQNSNYISACLEYRDKLSTLNRAETFIQIKEENRLGEKK